MMAKINFGFVFSALAIGIVVIFGINPAAALAASASEIEDRIEEESSMQRWS